VNLTQHVYLSFASATVCFVTYWQNMWPWRHCRICSMYFTQNIYFSGHGNHEF